MSTENQERRFFLLGETKNGPVVVSKQVGDVPGRTVAEANPDDLGRSSADDTQAMEILVLRHQQASVLACEIPDVGVRRASRTDQPDVERLRKQVGQRIDQSLRQGLVEEQSHASGRGYAQRSTFPFSRVGKAGTNVFAAQLRKLRQKLVLGCASRQVVQNVADRDACIPDARSSEPDGRVYRHSVEQLHRPSLREPRSGGNRPRSRRGSVSLLDKAGREDARGRRGDCYSLGLRRILPEGIWNSPGHPRTGPDVAARTSVKGQRQSVLSPGRGSPTVATATTRP